MKHILLSIVLLSSLFSQIWINEIDYDQPSTDESEFLEIAGPAGSYQNVTVVLMNGNNNSAYRTFDLGTVTLTDESQGYGFYVIGVATIPNVDYTSGFPASNAIQNGNPDGIELWVNGQIVDAVSYAGSMNDSEGNIMEEATPNDSDDAYWEGGEGLSIGRIGVDGSPWNVGANSPGAVNQAQTLDSDADYPPNANAGADQIISSGNVVTLDGSGSSDPNGTIVDYLWEQTAGSSVTLSANNLAAVSFTAPQVTETTTWTFLLTVEDDGGNTSDDEVNVTVYILSQITIYDIQENFATYDGQIVNVVGVVTIGDGFLYPSKTKFYIQDESGRGIQIYNDTPLDHVYSRGDYIEVIGTVTQFGDDVEITEPTITLLGTDSNLPQAHTVIGSEGLTMNGTWANATGILSDHWHYASGSSEFTALTITTSEGAEIQTMFWNSAVPSVELTEYEDMVGEELSILGAITFYNNVVQLTCGYETDIQTEADPTLPVADAGSDQSVSPGNTVTLDGSASSDTNGGIIEFEWRQLSGTIIGIEDDESAITTFIAPEELGVLVFQLEVWDSDGNKDTDKVNVTILSLSNTEVIIPAGYTLFQNYPNPFNPETIIEFEVVSLDHINISIFDLKGNLILDLVNKSFTPGEYSTAWNGKDKNGKPVPSGLYLYRYKSSMNIVTKRMLLVK